MVATTRDINNSEKNTFDSSHLARLREELDWLKRRFNATDEELIALLTGTEEERVPLSIFSQGLGILESLVLHLSERGMNPKEIAEQLKRAYTTITNTVNKARAKPRRLPTPSTITVPLAIFSDRQHAPLQALVTHLKDEENLRYSEIAKLLKRDSRNIHAAYKEVK